MGWSRPHVYVETLDTQNRRVLSWLDHGPQSSLDEARAERHLDHEPARAFPTLASVQNPGTAAARLGGNQSAWQHPDHPEAA